MTLSPNCFFTYSCISIHWILNVKMDKNFMEDISQPSHCYHKLYLLRKLHEMKNEIAQRSVKKFKIEILRKLMNERECVQDEVYTRMMELEKQIPSVIDSISVLKLRSNRANSENLVHDDILRTTKLEEFTALQSTYCPTSSDNLKSSSDSVTDFLSIIQSLSSLFNISTDEEFIQQRNQLMEILNMIKDYKSLDEILKNLRLKFEELRTVQQKFTDVLGKDVL